MSALAYWGTVAVFFFGIGTGYLLRWIQNTNTAAPRSTTIRDDRHPYFVWESGYAASVLDRIHGRDGTEGNPHTSNPYDVRTKG